MPINGFSASTNVTILAVLGPAGFSGSLNPSAPSVSSGETVTIRATAAMNTVPGTYQFAIRFTSGTPTHDQIVTLTVTAAPRPRAISR